MRCNNCGGTWSDSMKFDVCPICKTNLFTENETIGKPEEFFKFLIDRFGLEIFDNPKRCVAIFEDLFRDNKPVVNLIRNSFNLGVYTILAKAKDSNSSEKLIAIRKVVKELTDNFILEEKAIMAVGWLAINIYPNEWKIFVDNLRKLTLNTNEKNNTAMNDIETSSEFQNKTDEVEHTILLEGSFISSSFSFKFTNHKLYGFTPNGNKKIIISLERVLDEDRLGIVYKVNYDGKPKALKWYFTNKLKNSNEFKENLRKIIEKGKPSDSFIWPQLMLCSPNGEFGYITDLIPKGYNELFEYLVRKAKFKSNKVVIDAALDICSAFRALHLKGLSYHNLNSSNFFINEETGRVLICDNDNVAPDGDNKTGIQGNCRYMAPEVVLCKNQPDHLSDRFSLAIILFILLFRGHPLEGRKTLVPYVKEKHERLFYGEDPIFVYDPNNESNRPAFGVHNNIINTWKFYPESLKDMFIKAFSQESMKNPNNRIREREWADTFIKLHNSLVNCPFCNVECFSDSDTNTVFCPNCKKTTAIHGENKKEW